MTKKLTRRSLLDRATRNALTLGGLSLLAPLARADKRDPGHRAPAIFIGHGDPSNVVQDNPFTREWERIRSRLASYEAPTAILCVSAHWESDRPLVATADRPELIYDFYGFPDPMYQLTYPAPGFPDSKALLSAAVETPELYADPDRGLDHGAWCVLSRLYPAADVPVFQLSLSRSLSPRQHYELAVQLRDLRNRGVMILGSGNLVHNMRSWRHDAARGRTHLVHDWAEAFDVAVADGIVAGDHGALVRIAQDKPPLFRMAHPTYEHYLPLLYVLGAQHKGDGIEFFAEGFEEGSFSMRSVFMG